MRVLKHNFTLNYFNCSCASDAKVDFFPMGLSNKKTGHISIVAAIRSSNITLDKYPHCKLISASQKRPCISNAFSRWLRPCLHDLKMQKKKRHQFFNDRLMGMITYRYLCHCMVTVAVTKYQTKITTLRCHPYWSSQLFLCSIYLCSWHELPLYYDTTSVSLNKSAVRPQWWSISSCLLSQCCMVPTA